MLKLLIGYAFCRMLMSLSILFNLIFCFFFLSPPDRKAPTCCGFPRKPGRIGDKFIRGCLSAFVLTAVDSPPNPLFSQADKEFVWSLWKRLQVANPDLTQAVSLVVERWVDSSFKLLPEKLNSWKFLYLTSGEKCVWKSFKGCLRHLGHSAGVTTESGADADLSLLIPGLAVHPWKPF